MKFLAFLTRQQITRKGLRYAIEKPLKLPFVLTGGGALIFFAVAAMLWDFFT